MDGPDTLPCQRHLFDIPREVAYLNNASFTPLPRLVRAAGERGVGTKSAPWNIDQTADAAVANQVRRAAARFIGAAAEDIAIVNAVSYGVATAAANLALAPGARVLMIAGEFPSAALAWARLVEEQGATLELVPPPADGDWTAAWHAAIARPGPPVTIAVLTPVVWTDGRVIDLPSLVPALQAQGAAIVIDATQAAGVLPLDVAQLRPDFLMFPTYKWLLGPYTLAFLYVAPWRQSGRPLEQHGDGRVSGPAPFRSLDPMIVGAARFDMGERLNPVTLPMALAGMALLADWQQAPLAARLGQVTAALAEAAEAAGCAVVPARFRAPHVLGLHAPDAAALVAGLARHGVHAAARGGVVRLGVHAYNDAEDVARFATALRAVQSG